MIHISQKMEKVKKCKKREFQTNKLSIRQQFHKKNSKKRPSIRCCYSYDIPNKEDWGWFCSWDEGHGSICAPKSLTEWKILVLKKGHSFESANEDCFIKNSKVK